MANDHSPPSAGSEEGLRNLLARLEHQSLKPDFQIQRQFALSRALQPYLDPRMDPPLLPLPEEEDLAKWFVYADSYPADGPSSLIEQVRDLVTEHVPEEERVWLDSFRHSYMDLLEVLDLSPGDQSVYARLQSLGDQQTFEVLLPVTPVAYKIGHVLLTRLIRGLSQTRLPGPPLVLSANMGKGVFELTNEMRRDIEMRTGNFALAEWAEFAKFYGYMMMWSVAKVRRGTWAVVDSHIDYRNFRGETFLYAIALYEHHDFRLLADRLNGFEQFTFVEGKGAKPAPSVSGTETISWVWLPSQELSGDRKFPHRPSDLDAHTIISWKPTLPIAWIPSSINWRQSLASHSISRGKPRCRLTIGRLKWISYQTATSLLLLSSRRKKSTRSSRSFLETVYLDWAEKSSPASERTEPPALLRCATGHQRRRGHH